jgi:hypothetical protein
MSLLDELFNTINKGRMGEVAETLGMSEQSASHGIRSTLATVLGGMAGKSDNPTLLRSVLDLAPSGAETVSPSSFTSGFMDPNSPLMATGKRMLSALFGGSEGRITQALAGGTGLQPSATSSLLTMAAPFVMSFLGRRVRDDGMSMQGLGSLLQREVPSLRAALPSGVADLLLPRERVAAATSPVITQHVTREPSRAGWWLPLLLLLLIPAFWWARHPRRPVVLVQPPPVTTGTANRIIPETAVPPNLRKVVLYFDTASTDLRPASNTQLNQVAGTLAANRDAHVNVTGYTDNVGNADSNTSLSQQRADAVKADLVRRGIAEDRITAKGMGEESPAADNATAHGRDLNRRVSVEVTDR